MGPLWPWLLPLPCTTHILPPAVPVCCASCHRLPLQCVPTVSPCSHMRACWQPRSPSLPLGLEPSLTHVTGPHTEWAHSLALAARHLQALSPSLHHWPPLLCMCPQLAPAAARVHTNSKGQSCLWVWSGSHSYDWPVVLQGPASSTPICIPAHHQPNSHHRPDYHACTHGWPLMVHESRLLLDCLRTSWLLSKSAPLHVSAATPLSDIWERIKIYSNIILKYLRECNKWSASKVVSGEPRSVCRDTLPL